MNKEREIYMSDVKGIEISDIFGLSQPLTKLIETVSCGIGKLYEPTHIKRLAKAKAEEIRVISDTVADNLNLPVSYHNGEIGIDATDANGLVQRAENRFLFQQMKKQQNIEAVVENAYEELSKTTVVSSNPVDEDWISSFFDFVANVSNDQMQILWGKVLAGEVEKPGSFSIRTLDVLRKMTQEDARCFANIVPFVLKCPGDKDSSYYDFFIPAYLDSKKRLLEKYGVSFPSIIRLDEAQLVSSNSLISVGSILQPGGSALFEGSSAAVSIKNIGSNDIKLYHSAYLLTAAGMELFSVVSDVQCQCAPEWYLQDFTKSLIGTTEESSVSNDLEISFV